jgi:hypothetical protein
MDLIKQALKNIHHGPLTTFFGVVIFIGCCVAAFMQKISFGDFLQGFGVVLLLLGCPDPDFTKGDKSGGATILLLCLLCSCTLPKSGIATNTTTREIYRDTTYNIPGGKASATINDSLISVLHTLIKQGKEPKIIYRDPGSPTNLTIKLDSLGRLKADCVTDPETIKAMIKEVLVNNNTTKTEVIKETPEWVKVLLAILFGMIFFAFVIIYLLANKKIL